MGDFAVWRLLVLRVSRKDALFALKFSHAFDNGVKLDESRRARNEIDTVFTRRGTDLQPNTKSMASQKYYENW